MTSPDSKISTVKKCCQLITSPNKGFKQALLIPDKSVLQYCDSLYPDYYCISNSYMFLFVVLTRIVKVLEINGLK